MDVAPCEGGIGPPVGEGSLQVGSLVHRRLTGGSTYLRAPKELCVQPTMGDTTGEVYKPLGSLLRHSRGSGAEIDGGVNIFCIVLSGSRSEICEAAHMASA